MNNKDTICGSILSIFIGPKDIGWIFADTPFIKAKIEARKTIKYKTFKSYCPEVILINKNLEKVSKSLAPIPIIVLDSTVVKSYFDRLYAFDVAKQYYNTTTYQIEEPLVQKALNHLIYYTVMYKFN